MFLFLHNNHSHFFFTICQWVFVLLTINLTYSQPIFTAEIVSSNPGTQFAPVSMSAQLISTTLTDSVKSCAILCMTNVMCRIYDYDVPVPKQCRLFEGDVNTLGQIVSSSSPQSSVGTIHFSSDLFAEYGSPCTSFCYQSRYLQCGNNFTCECMPHTYWDASVSMCLSQSPILGASCQQNKSMCRKDLNYTCLQFNQCGPLSLLAGTTIMNSTTAISGSSTAGLSYPYGIALCERDSDSIAIADTFNNRVVGVWNIGTINKSISVVATEWVSGQPLSLPMSVYVDVRNGCNTYVSDYIGSQVILYTNMQSISPPPRVVAGTGHVGGPGLDHLNYPWGIQVDSHYNVFVVSTNDNRIMFWPNNAKNGTVIAVGLRQPCGIALDERNSWLYVADSGNHRIQRYSLNDTWPCTGTTVAGGNGPGIGSNQLSGPTDIKLSSKTGAMYIVDSSNSRIQRWEQGALVGVTIAGNPNGNRGGDVTTLDRPVGIAINTNETRMYVTDFGNSRVQRFSLIQRVERQIFA